MPPNGKGTATLAVTSVLDNAAMSKGLYSTPAIAAAANRNYCRYRETWRRLRCKGHATSPYNMTVPARGNRRLESGKAPSGTRLGPETEDTAPIAGPKLAYLAVQ